MSFVKELKRRKVFRVAIAYLIAAWLLLQIADVLSGILELPAWASKLALYLLVIAFIPALILAWAYELTPTGLTRDTGISQHSTSGGDRRQTVPYSIIVLLSVLLIAGIGYWFSGQDARHARNEDIPRLEAFIDAGEYEAAYALAIQIEKILPEDPVVAGQWARFTWLATIPSDPPGATVYRRGYNDFDADWENLGTTPIHGVRIPVGMSLLRIELEDHRPLLRVIGNGFPVSSDMPVADRSQNTLFGANPERYVLDPVGVLPEDMVRVPGARIVIEGEMTEISDFFISKFEVTNRDFKEFVAAGGYSRRDLWQEEFLLEGESIAWEQAMEQFFDKSGRPGPSTWQAGNYADGEADHPVTGVSWYEAAAYAAFVDRDLPTVHHWRRAFSLGTLPWILPASNLEGDRSDSVGINEGIGWTGTYDMAGNSREWCYSGVGHLKTIVGGGFNDSLYVVQESIQDPATAPPFDRSFTNGSRIALEQDGRLVSNKLRNNIPEPKPVVHPEPISADAFSTFTSAYAYDASPLNAKVDDVTDELYWTRETISFDAGYRGERMFAYLYLPKSFDPPFQTIVFWPGISGLYVDSVNHKKFHLEFALKNGRAVIFPILQGMFQRRLPSVPKWTSVAGRDLAIQQVKDMRRAIDYLETRRDIDSDALAYYGISWGGRMGPNVLVVEPRLKVGILNQAGIEPNVHYDISAVHFLPRVTVPVLQFNGRYDADFRYQTQAKPFFDGLGTSDADKKWVVEATGHFVPPPVYIGETLDWLDKYLGSITSQEFVTRAE